jgi:predicted nucleic acid-binding protein
MDAAELLNGGASFVIDTSAWWRVEVLPPELLRPLRRATMEDRMLVTPVVRMQILYSAGSSAEYAAYDAELSALRMLRNDRAVADAAMSALSELASRSDGDHRVSVTDALIAAAAAEHGRLAVLHNDGHFDRLAEVLAFESVSLPVD